MDVWLLPLRQDSLSQRHKVISLTFIDIGWEMLLLGNVNSWWPLVHLLTHDLHFIVLPESLEVSKLSLHELLDHSIVSHNEGLLGKVVLGVLKQLSEGDT